VVHVVVEVLSDIGGEGMLKPGEGDVDRVVLGHDAVDVLWRGDQVAHAPALQSERLGEASHYSDIGRHLLLLDRRVQTMLGPDEVAVALIEDDEAIQLSSHLKQLLHNILCQYETRGVARVAKKDAIELVLHDGRLDLLETHRQVLVARNEEYVLLRPNQSSLLHVVSIEGLHQTDARLAVSLQKVHRRNYASSHSTDRQNVIFSKVNLELMRQDVMNSSNVVLLTKTTTVRVNGLVLLLG